MVTAPAALEKLLKRYFPLLYSRKQYYVGDTHHWNEVALLSWFLWQFPDKATGISPQSFDQVLNLLRYFLLLLSNVIISILEHCCFSRTYTLFVWYIVSYHIYNFVERVSVFFFLLLFFSVFFFSSSSSFSHIKLKMSETDAVRLCGSEKSAV